jgi:tetratricopeptide (TPR) repeat protein
LIATALRCTSRGAFQIAALVLSSVALCLPPAVAAQELSERLAAIDALAMSGDMDRIRTSIEEYQQLETVDSAPEVQWRLLRAYGNLFSELSCRDRRAEQKAVAKAGYEFAVGIDAAHSDKPELVYYYADISGRYYQDRLIRAVWSRFLGGFDPIESCENALMMDEDIEYAGPHRCLGALYLSLPGSKDPQKALEHLQEAIDRFPRRVANRYWYAKALATAGGYKQAWTHIKGIQEADFTVGEDVSSEHWARIYLRRVQSINQGNIKDFARGESEDGCAGLNPAGRDD